MAQIITLKEIQNRNPVLRGSTSFDGRSSDKSLGPAQLLFFTGVRYERYGNEAEKPAAYRAKSSRKHNLTN